LVTEIDIAEETGRLAFMSQYSLDLPQRDGRLG